MKGADSMVKVKDIYNFEQLQELLNEVVRTKQETTIIFHEDEYGFPGEEISAHLSFSSDDYHVQTEEFGFKTFTSKWTFKDYVFAVCGW